MKKNSAIPASMEHIRQMLLVLQPPVIFLPTGRIYERVFVADIVYFMSSENYGRIYTSIGQHPILITMKEFLGNLPSDKFCRVNRSYIVNIGWVVA